MSSDDGAAGACCQPDTRWGRHRVNYSRVSDPAGYQDLFGARNSKRRRRLSHTLIPLSANNDEVSKDAKPTFLLVLQHSEHVYVIFYCNCSFHVECRRYLEHVLKIALEIFFQDWPRVLIPFMLQIV